MLSGFNFFYLFICLAFLGLCGLTFLLPNPQVSVSKARAIIVLASDENADQVHSQCLYPVLWFLYSDETFLKFFFLYFCWARVMHVL